MPSCFVARRGALWSAMPMPPGRQSADCSTISASTPACDSAIAAAMPAGPPPTINTFVIAPG